MLEVAKAASLRAMASDAAPQVANFGFLAEGPKFRELHRVNSFHLFENFLGRHALGGKMDTPHYLMYHSIPRSRGCWATSLPTPVREEAQTTLNAVSHEEFREEFFLGCLKP